MSKEIVRPIYDTRTRILDLNVYPYTTGRVFFDTENQVIYTDIDGNRSARTDLSSVQVLDGNIQEFYEKGAKGFENQIMVGRTPTGFRLYYVDNSAQVHNLTFTAESVGSLSERGVTETATFYYAGNWKANKTYTADAFRIAVVKQAGNFYYAKETHTVPLGDTFDSNKWLKFSAQFESVATGLLLAEDAVITRTLTIGQEGVNNGVIKSANVNSVANLQNGIDTGFWLDNDGTVASNKGFFGPLNLGFLNQEFIGTFTTPGGTTAINIPESGFVYTGNPLTFDFPSNFGIVSLRFQFQMFTNLDSLGKLIQPPASGGYIIEIENVGRILKTGIVSSSFSSNNVINLDQTINMDSFVADKLRIIPFGTKSSNLTTSVTVVGGGSISYTTNREIFNLGTTKIYDSGFLEADKAIINNLTTNNFVNTKVTTLNTFTSGLKFPLTAMGGLLVMNQSNSAVIKFPTENFSIGAKMKILRRNGVVTIDEGDGDDSIELISKNGLSSIQLNGVVTLKQIALRVWSLYGDLE